MHLLHEAEFWFTIAVVVFVAIMWRPAKRFVIGGLDARAARIRDELETASNLREEAERMLAQLRDRERETAAEAEQIAGEAARALEEALHRRQQLAEERIAQEEARAVAEIRAVTVDIAIAAARQVIAAQLDEQRGAALIDRAIAELPNLLH